MSYKEARSIWNELDILTRQILLSRCCAYTAPKENIKKWSKSRFERLPEKIQNNLVGFVRGLKF